MGRFTATGYAAKHLPLGKRTDELMRTLRLGVKFGEQHKGKRPEALSKLVLDCARRTPPPHTFDDLLDQLALEAARRNLYGEKASPVEKVDRIWELVTIHKKGRNRIQLTFGTIRNHLTAARKIIRAEQIPTSPKP